MMSAYFNAFLNGDLEPKSTHFWLLAGAVVGSLVVAAGIALEANWPISRMKLRELAGITFVFFGVAVEALFTIALFMFDEGLSSGQQKTISTQQSKIIELETRLAPRHLEQAAKLIDRAKAFSGTKFAMASGSSAETEGFAVEIAEALKSAGWQWISWPLGNQLASAPPGGRPLIGLDLMAGIETHVFDKSKEPAAVELFEGLSDAGFQNHWVLQASNPAVADVLIIIVGSKE
jgi:hypothetical protein